MAIRENFAYESFYCGFHIPITSLIHFSAQEMPLRVKKESSGLQG
jgi:hypothetical protein